MTTIDNKLGPASAPIQSTGIHKQPPSDKNLSAGVDASTGGAAADFVRFARMTPAERFQDQWLKAHKLTREQFDALPAAERAKLQQQMTDDMRKKLEAAGLKTGLVTISA